VVNIGNISDKTSVGDPDPHPHQIKIRDPHPHQSNKLDLEPDPDPHRFADDKPKCMEFEPI
jgi:hypothetical protein